MKKFLALLISVFMLSGIMALPTFSADAGAYLDDADMEGVAYTSGVGSWVVRYVPDSANDQTVNSLAATVMDSSASNFNVGSKVSAAVYKVALPELPEGKEIDTAQFRVSSYYSTSEAREIPYAYKMSGEAWDMDTITIADAQDIIDGNSIGSGDNFIATCTKEDAYAAAPVYRNKYDISEYAAECMSKGQDYMWIAVTRPSTVKAYRHDVGNGGAKLYYTVRDSLGFVATESVPADGTTDYNPKGTATVTYSAPVASAKVTINDSEVLADAVTITDNNVSVKLDLDVSTDATVMVEATDFSGNTDIYEFTFTTASKYEFYDDSDVEGVDFTLANGSWILSYDPAATDTTALAATEMATSDANYNVGNKKNAAVYRVALPEIPQGKELNTAEFRMSTYYSNTQARVMPYAYKMPGDEWDMASIKISDAQKIIDGNNLGSGDYHLQTISYDESYANAPVYRSKYNVSDYAAQAIVNGQDYMWIAVTYQGTIKAFRHNYEGQEAKLYFTLKDVEALTVTNQTITEGATAVYPIGSASVSFSNLVASATATIDGKEVASENIEILGKTVNVSFDLGLNAQTALVVTAADANGQTLSHTINFTTDSKYKFYDDSDMKGIEYTQGEGSWVMSFDPAIEDATTLAASPIPSASNINVGNGIKAAVYKMKLPEIPEGKRIKMAEFRVSSWYNSQRFLTHIYKMPGDNWNMDTVTIADARSIIDGNNLGSGDNFICGCSSDASYFDGVSSNRGKYDVTAYINECIKNGDEYAYLAATHGYTIKAYAHDSGTNGAKLYYTLEDIPEEELSIAQPKFVDASSDAEYSASSEATVSVGKDIKAISLMTNTTAENVNLKVAVAQYIGNKLVSISFVPYTLKTETENKTVEFGTMTVESGVTAVKAFIWKENLSNITPAKAVEIK